MHFNFVLVSCFLLVPAVLATDNTGSWAGAILEKGDGAFDYVTGNFTAPNLVGDLNSGIAQWVAIDLYGCHKSFGSLMSGINSTITDSGLQHQGFLSWHPNAMTTFGDISTGDIIRITLNISDPSTASLSFENSNGKPIHQTFQSSTVLCGSQAGWMIGYPTESENDFPSFDPLSITGATAGVQGSPSYTPSDDNVKEADDPGGVTDTTNHPEWTKTTVHSANASLTVTYLPRT